MLQRYKYYSLKKILATDSLYNVVIGPRSNGKTYDSLDYALRKYVDDGEQFAYLRRYAIDIETKRMRELFASHNENGVVKKLTKNQWDRVTYKAGRFWFSKTLYKDNGDVEKELTSEEPIGFAFYLGGMEHDKSVSYPKITTIIFDEFISREYYLPDEFTVFTNMLSTIIRLRTNVKIFMLGNTVNKYCPYFKEMGLKHITKMKQGTIDVYKNGDDERNFIAVEYCDEGKNNSKPSNVYFAFDNPKMKMITQGIWELDVYPHAPCKFEKDDIQFIFFLKFDERILQCEIVCKDEMTFLYIHEKTSPVRSNTDIVYSQEYNPSPYHRRNILKPAYKFERKIQWYFKADQVYYQDNDVGELVRNYLMWCQKN